MSRWPFSVLGVEPGAEPREIKRAYARLLKAAHPEDDPAGFQALREAYEAATSGYWIPRQEDIAEPANVEVRERPAEPAAAPRPVTLVPVSASADEELWELKHELADLVDDPAATDEARRAALSAVLASPALENVSRLSETEAWIGGLIADYGPAADALLDPVIRRFGWDAQQRRWDLPWFVAAALQRRDALTFVGQLKDPKGAYRAGYLLLQKPPPRSVFFKSRKVGAVLRLLDDHPGLEPEFDPERVDEWRERLDTMPFKPPASWKSAAGTLFFILWIGLMIFKFVSPEETLQPAPASYLAVQDAREVCRKAARAPALMPDAERLCTDAQMKGGQSLSVLGDKGLIRLRQKQWLSAESAWDAVLQKSPFDARALYGRGLARRGLAYGGRGVADMEQALALNSEVAVEFAQYGLAKPPEIQPRASTGPVPSVLERIAAARHVSPTWAARPGGDEVNRLYPQAAARKGVGGRVVVSCEISAAGSLADCVVLAETPPDLGFADAAIKLAESFKANPQPASPGGGAAPRVRMPISFQMEGETA